MSQPNDKYFTLCIWKALYQTYEYSIHHSCLIFLVYNLCTIILTRINSIFVHSIAQKSMCSFLPQGSNCMCNISINCRQLRNAFKSEESHISDNRSLLIAIKFQAILRIRIEKHLLIRKFDVAAAEEIYVKVCVEEH